MSTGISCPFGHLLQVSKTSLWSLILYMYIAPRQGQTAPRGQSFNVNRNVFSLHSFVASFKKISSESDFIQVFRFNTCILPQCRGRQPLGNKILMSTETSHHFIFFASFDKMSLKSDIIQFFHDIAPGQGRQAPGDRISMSTEKPYPYTHLLQVSKISLWSLMLYIFFMI